jgi:glyoxylase-like metal-dependent hydrolase (beta-lactamase superfamily II)
MGGKKCGPAHTYVDRSLDSDRVTLELGGVGFELLWLGDAHFPGDAVVWLPDAQVLFSGDLVYVDRMLGVLPWSAVKDWQAAFLRMEALAPRIIVPGHGPVCDLAKARRDTGDYLDWLVRETDAALEDREALDTVVARLADAPQFRHLQHYDSWHRVNVSRTYLQLEGE